MKADPVIGPHVDEMVGTRNGLGRQDHDTYIRRFIWRVFERDASGSDAAIDAVYAEFERFFHSRDLHLEVLSPLVNFSIESDDVDLGNGIRIVPTPADIQVQFDRFPDYEEVCLPLHFPRPTGFCLYSEVSTKKMIKDFPPKEKETDQESAILAFLRVQQTIGLLRLFQPGVVGSFFVLQRAKGWIPAQLGYSWSFGSIAPLPFLGSPFFVPENMVKELVGFCTWCVEQLSKASRDIYIAFRRFNFSYERANPEDSLVDLIVALEALFLRREEVGELGYRLGIRVAGALGRNGNERQKIFKFISRAYQQRNSIVHGSTVPDEVKVPGDKKVPFKSFVSLLENYVRQSIRKTLDMPLKRDERINALEARVLIGRDTGS